MKCSCSKYIVSLCGEDRLRHQSRITISTYVVLKRQLREAQAMSLLEIHSHLP